MQRLHLTAGNEEEALARAAEVLGRGGLVVYPTETMYGAGVDATNPEAVGRLLSYKNRPAGKAISVLVPDRQAAGQLVEVSATAEAIYRAFLPGPVTVVSRSLGAVDRRLESELGTLGIRISSHPFAGRLAGRLGRPVTATSANASGKARPYSLDKMLSQLSARQRSLIDLAVDAGELPRREPSTVIDTTGEVQEVVRGGAALEALLPPLRSASPEQTATQAASLTSSLLHALPEKPVVFALEGEMGAGKTQFAKGVAKALGVEGPVTSPTYALMKEYRFGKEGLLLHLDCWRLPSVRPEELLLEQYLRPWRVLVIEWAAPLLPFLKEEAERLVGYRLNIEAVGDSERLISIGAL